MINNKLYFFITLLQKRGKYKRFNLHCFNYADCMHTFPHDRKQLYNMFSYNHKKIYLQKKQTWKQF